MGGLGGERGEGGVAADGEYWLATRTTKKNANRTSEIQRLGCRAEGEGGMGVEPRGHTGTVGMQPYVTWLYVFERRVFPAELLRPPPQNTERQILGLVQTAR